MLLVPVLLGNLRSLEVFGAVGAAGFLDRQEATGSGISVGKVWPSGLRQWLKAPFRKGVGSNPTALAIEWTHWGLSPGPSACEADVIPLHHVPLNGGAP